MPLGKFHKDKSKPDGRYTICKECRAGLSTLPEIAPGYRQCIRCDEIKPDSEFYPAGEGRTRQTCKDCCDSRWTKNYRPAPGRRPGHLMQSLLGYLSKAEQTAIRRSNPKIRKRVRLADRRYKQSEKGRLRRQNWVENNNDKLRGYEHRRRARAQGVASDFSEDDWQVTLSAFGEKCAYCGQDKSPLEQDHWISVSRGGAYTLGNIVPACKSCNCSKRNKMPNRFCDDQAYMQIGKVLTQLGGAE